MLWDKKEEWKGFFFVMWIFIKDIPNKILKNITNELNEGKSVVESRNVEEINYSSGMKMMKIELILKRKKNTLIQLYVH